jgi:diguanylate cyclase (GGDEF)-like protein
MNGEGGPSTRILFVDDSRVVLKTAYKILSAEFDVITAIDGDDAWKKLALDPDVQVVFTDINMPGTDGFGLLNKVRSAEDPGMHGMPVILVTGADDDESARQLALERGATDFLNKKYMSSELLTRARAHAKYQRITLQLRAQSMVDPQTGLANEQGFLVRLEQDIAYARRHGDELALVRVEIDHMVATLQYLGDSVVEQIVVQVANLIRKRIRVEDTAGRLGKGSFAISLPGGHLDGIEAMAAFLHDQAAHALKVDGQVMLISLTTAVISTRQGVWKSTLDALDRSEAELERARQRVPKAAVPKAVKPSQPAVSEPTVARTPTKPAEPATVQATPTEESPRLDALRFKPKQRRWEPIGKKQNVLKRLLAFLRLHGARLLARLGRFLRKLVGK